MSCPLISLLHQARLDEDLTWTGSHTYTGADGTDRVAFNTAVQFPDSATPVISSGAISISKSAARVNAESGTVDDLDTINVSAGVTDGFLLLLTAAAGDTITIIGDGSGNIKTQRGTDLVLTEETTVLLRYSETDGAWHLIGDNAVVGGPSLVSGAGPASLPYNIGPSDDGRVLVADTSGGNGTVSLPASSLVDDGFTVVILHSVGDSNTLTISRNGADTIGGADANRTLAVSGSGYILTLLGTDWRVIGTISPILPIPVSLGGTGSATAAGALSNLGAEATANKNATNGYAGLTSGRVTKGTLATDDLIVDDSSKGLVLKDTQGTPHYWRITIDNSGALVSTDLGTSVP